MKSRFCALSLALLGTIIVLLVSPPATAQTTCLRKHFDQLEGNDQATASDVQLILSEVSQSIGLSRKVAAVDCGGALVNKAEARRTRGVPGVPDGDYIVYDPTWVREVVGSDRWHAVVIFSHELAHVLNDDLSGSDNGISRLQQELLADEFAGCAVARLNGEWSSLDNVLSRLRAEKTSTHPNRLSSLEAAKKGFERCKTFSAPAVGSVVGSPCEGLHDRAVLECTASEFWKLVDNRSIDQAWASLSDQARSQFSKPFFTQQLAYTIAVRGNVRSRTCITMQQYGYALANPNLRNVSCNTNAEGGKFAEDVALELLPDGSWRVTFFSSLKVEEIR